MNGIGFIVSEKGDWACSDDVFFDIETDLIPGEDKKKFSKTETLKYFSIFEGRGDITKGLRVWCLFKSGDKKTGFKGVVRGKHGELTVIDLHSGNENINAIIQKIKGGN